MKTKTTTGRPGFPFFQQVQVQQSVMNVWRLMNPDVLNGGMSTVLLEEIHSGQLTVLLRWGNIRTNWEEMTPISFFEDALTVPVSRL